MKLTRTPSIKRKSGMTLLELTVVILVLLSLISILFIGARAWKKGSDRSANIMNLRNVQQAARGHANMNGLNQGDALTSEKIINQSISDTAGYLKAPRVPWNSTLNYSYLAVVPATGTLYCTAPAEGLVGAAYGPKAGETDDW